MNNQNPVVKIIPLRKKVALSREFSKHASNLHKEHAIKKHLLKKSLKSGLNNFENIDLKQALKQTRRIPSLYIIQSLLLAGIVSLVVIYAVPSLRTPTLQALNDRGIYLLGASEPNANSSTNTSQNVPGQSGSRLDNGNSQNSNSSNNDDAYTNGDNSSSDGGQNEGDQNPADETKVSSALRNAILRTYGVASLSDIRETGLLEGMSQIHSITEVNANKLTVRLNLTHSNTNRQAVRAIANKLLEIARANNVQATTIIVITIDSYFLEQASNGGN
ncbi:MAG: hypothetical protein LBC50_00400 [Candidatus Ancillula sp.]|nr:hypothetical protein [Candidatus Ancillula sp.]